MFKSILLTTFLLTSVVGFAQSDSSVSLELKNNPAFKITSISISEIEPVVQINEAALPTNPIGDILATVDGIIATGQKIWKIVDSGRPVINTKFAPTINALPELVGENGTLRLMANWSIPKARSFRISYKNGWNKEVVAFSYTVYFQFNGSYKGVGKYISNLKVQASDIYTSWGFNLDASSELIGISNVGSMDAPIASAIVQISYGVKGLLNETRNTQSFYVDGAGTIQII